MASCLQHVNTLNLITPSLLSVSVASLKVKIAVITFLRRSGHPRNLILDKFWVLSGKADWAWATGMGLGYISECAKARVVGITEAL